MGRARLNSMYKKLLAGARKLRKNSYSPYSGYKVAAAVWADDGKIYSGTNIENSSYGATICAERAAIFTAICAGAKKIRTVLVMTDEKEPWPPCGMCRQVMAEFATKDTNVLIADLRKIRWEAPLRELLPASHGKEHLLK